MSGNGFRITCEDLATGESSTVEIVSGDFMLIPTGTCYLHKVAKYTNGTVVLTLKGYAPLRGETS